MVVSVSELCPQISQHPAVHAVCSLVGRIGDPVALLEILEEERMPHPSDRRAFAVTLTAKARDLLPALDAQGRTQEAEITAPLTAEECAALLSELQRVSAAVGLIPGLHPKLV